MLPIQTLAFAYAGGFMNRVRGGLLPYGGTANALVFGVFAGLAHGSWTTAALATVGMYAGQQPGWGKYIGALSGRDTEDLEEFGPIDWVISGLKGAPELWGFAGLVLRGLLWGACLALPLWQPWPMLAGAAMPLFYLWLVNICRLLETANPEGDGWEWAEVLFGAWLWAHCVGGV